MLFLNQKYIYEILIGSCEKAKVPCMGQPTSARSIYSWSRDLTEGERECVLSPWKIYHDFQASKLRT